MYNYIKSRRSIRKYKNKAISDEIVMKLMEGARLAPSGSNTQPANFIIVKSEDIKKEIVKVSHNQQWMLSAPVFIVCIGDLNSRIKESGNMYIDESSCEEEVKQIIRDTSIAAEHIVLNAVSLGLGTCWVAWFTQDKIRPILNIPSDKYVVSVITLGYPNEKPNPRSRKGIDEIIHYDVW